NLSRAAPASSGGGARTLLAHRRGRGGPGRECGARGRTRAQRIRPCPAEAAGASASRVPSSQAPLILSSVRSYLMFDLIPVWKSLRGRGKRRVTKPPVESRPRRAGSRLSLEPLEGRTLLSVSFAPAVSLPVGFRPVSMVTADTNNDGNQDIVALNQG